MSFWRRNRTIILGTLAMLLLLYSAVYSFDVEWSVMLTLLAACLVMCTAMVLLAAIAAAIMTLCRRLLGKDSDASELTPKQKS